MENLFVSFVIVVGIIVVTSILNEKKLKMPRDIALMLVAFAITLCVLGVQQFSSLHENIGYDFKENFQLTPFLLECTLGFIVFAEAGKSHLHKFVKNVVPISLLVMVGTLVSTLVYGGLFYGISCALHWNFGFWLCLLLGGILSSLESGTSISVLEKQGASKSLVSVIEGESFFNDGMGITIFVFITEILRKGMMPNFFVLILQEFLGAALVGLIVSYLFFQLLKMSNEPLIHILISLLTVSFSYLVCEYMGFSVLIAAVVCGLSFSYQSKKVERWREVVDSKELYYDFWNVLEELLNSVLFVLVGLSVISMNFTFSSVILIPIAVLLNLISRAVGVAVATCFMGAKKIPGHYSFGEFIKIMTWGGLKGGHALLLVMSAKALVSDVEYGILLNVVMVTILFTTIVQGLTMARFYQGIEKGKMEKRLMIKNKLGG